MFLAVTTLQQNFYSQNQIVMFKRSLQHNPENIRVRNSLALVYALAGKYRDAQWHYEQSLKVNPVDPASRIGLGKTFVDQGKIWEGIGVYEEVKYTGRYDELLKENIRKAYEELMTAYIRRMEYEKDNAQLYYSLGVVYTKLWRLDDATYQFEEALRLDPKNRNALFNLASVYETLGKDEVAKIHYLILLKDRKSKDGFNEYAKKRLKIMKEKKY